RNREIKWKALMARFRPGEVRRSRRVRKLLRHGIPESIRGRVWLYLADVEASYRRPGVFEALLSPNREPLPIYEAIERDIHRCYPNHVHFLREDGPGQGDLHRVLRAYARYNPAVGYCQGMGRLVGMMLMYMPAEDAFWLLVATIDTHLTGYYTPTLARLKVDCTVLARLIDLHLPPLGAHLKANDVEPLMYATQWFLTLFTMSLPWSTVLLTWDHFYLSGTKVLFRIALGILQSHRTFLLRQCPSSTELLHHLLHLPQDDPSLQPRALLDTAYRIPIRRSEIEKLTRRVYREEA
ncbi:MAG: rab-GTPase-TBC domain-containing protein, partial [Piptocephalis tieghemiana]